MWPIKYAILYVIELFMSSDEQKKNKQNDANFNWMKIVFVFVFWLCFQAFEIEWRDGMFLVVSQNYFAGISMIR